MAGPKDVLKMVADGEYEFIDLRFSPDGKLRLAVGAAGGWTIPAQVIRAVIGVTTCLS